MTIAGIQTAVQALLVSTNKFSTVLGAAPNSVEDFAGYPSAAHYYVDTQSDYATVSQNRRVITYAVDLYLVTNEATTLQEEFDQGYAHIDDVIQLFDESNDLNNACDIMRPAPGQLVRVTLPEGTGLRMTITLYCEADVTFRNS